MVRTSARYPRYLMLVVGCRFLPEELTPPTVGRRGRTEVQDGACRVTGGGSSWQTRGGGAQARGSGFLLVRHQGDVSGARTLAWRPRYLIGARTL